jgi:signal transduction histidine kinase
VVTDAGGRPILMLGTAQDITDRRRADEERLQLAHEQALRREAEAANQAKDEFLTILSHELRTPVNAVMGWAQLLEQGRLDEPGRRKALDAIRRNATIQTELVSDILDASRIRTGTLSLDRQPMELSAAIENAVDSVRPAALAKGIQIATELQPVSIVGDVQRLGQVVRNLLTNSVKFASSGGRIRLSSWCVDSHVAIVVEDDGPGISPDFLPHLFEQFRQADPSTTREHQGLGLGLAIVRRIVESHGGTVDASNRTDGQGAVFTVRLPLEPEPASPTFHSG